MVISLHSSFTAVSAHITVAHNPFMYQHVNLNMSTEGVILLLHHNTYLPICYERVETKLTCISICLVQPQAPAEVTMLLTLEAINDLLLIQNYL